MANYNKSFNFRNGVQVDEDDLIVRGSLVGIGTTVPRAELDVYGTLKSNGIITANNLYVSGIATFTDIQIGTGITIIGNSGTIAAKFYGDGAGLYNIPTSQWVDVDPAVFAPLPPPPGAGTGYTSIYAAGTVGIGTTIPRFYLQLGGDPTLNQNGVGISSTGDMIVSGILTSGFFVGSGVGITSIDASNISLGTLNNSRLPSNISISGIGTFETVSSTNTVISGIATVGLLSATNAYLGIGTIVALQGTNAQISTATLATLYSNIGIVTTLSGATVGYTTGNITNLNALVGVVTTISGTNLNYSGIATIGIMTAANIFAGAATIGVASITSGTFSQINTTNLNASGISTVGYITASSSYIGHSTALSLESRNVRLSALNSNVIDTKTGNLILDSASGITSISDNLIVSGTSVMEGEITVNTGLVPDTQFGAYLGQSGKEFSEAYIDDIRIGVGVGNSNKITTSTGNLVLDANTNLVIIDADLSIVGVTTFTNDFTFGSNVLPSSDLSANLGSSIKRFSSAYINAIRIGAAQTSEIDTIFGSDLILNASSGKTRINNDLFVTGIGSFSGNLFVSQGLIPSISNSVPLGSSSLSFGQAYINNVTLGVSGSSDINTKSGNLILKSNSNLVEILSDLNVSGISSFSSSMYVAGVSTFAAGILPNINNTASIGSSSKYFYESYINRSYLNQVTIGIANTNQISTQSGKLILSGNNNLVEVSSDAKILNNLNVVGTSLFDSNVTVSGSAYFGGQNSLVVNNITGFVGVGTSIPQKRFEVLDDNELQSQFRSNTSVVKVGVGKSSVGDGQLTGHVGYSGTTLTIVNEDAGGIDFVTHDGLPGLADTVGFRWIYGQTNETVMSLSHTGNLSVQNLTLTGSLVAIGTTALSSIGSGVSITSISPISTIDYGKKGTLIFNDDDGITAISANDSSITLGLSTTITRIEVLGIGTAEPRSVLDFGEAGKTYENGGYAFMILPRLSDDDISGLSTNFYGTEVSGGVVFNTTTNKFQGWTGTQWVNFH